ncbi:MAG TPA: cupredoxin domain-containing protein, partial [Armatimonadota bacterium]|nr:cupredoxin domain-containing protein [Armatimonadota bacterium]
PFTFLVQDLWAKSAAPRPAASGKSAPKAGVQQATIAIDGEYQPAQVSVRAGKPVRLTFVRKKGDGCGDVVQFPTLGLKRTLKHGETATVVFTPKRAGAIPFTCGMKMYKGQVVAR